MAAGLTMMGVGAGGYLTVVRVAPGAVWAVALPLLACGIGMGCCFGSVFAVALGDVRPEQAGSASGTLNAVQQIANAVGTALISTAYLAVASTGTAGQAVTASLVTRPCHHRAVPPRAPAPAATSSRSRPLARRPARAGLLWPALDTPARAPVAIAVEAAIGAAVGARGEAVPDCAELADLGVPAAD